MSKYTMEVIRFKKSGKFYDHIAFETDRDWMYQISEDFENAGKEWPHWESFDYLLTGNLFSEELFEGYDHPNGFPYFIHTS